MKILCHLDLPLKLKAKLDVYFEQIDFSIADMLDLHNTMHSSR